MSSTLQTRQRLRNEQTQGQDETFAGMTDCVQAEENHRSMPATTEPKQQPGEDYTMPSASFIDEM